MTSLLRFFRGLNALLLFIPVSVALHYTPHMNPLWVFLAAALAIVPLAGLMGKATEELAGHLGAAWGGLLNATFGNATELIIGLFALHEGLISLVRASIVGSIIGNLLLVLGASILAGGIKHKIQTFNQDQAESHAINLLLATLSLAVPAIFAMHYNQPNNPANPDVEHLSLWVSGILLVVYLASLWFSLRTHESLFRDCEAEAEEDPPKWNKRTAFTVLGAATLLVAVESEFLVSSVQGAAGRLGVNVLRALAFEQGHVLLVELELVQAYPQGTLHGQVVDLVVVDGLRMLTHGRGPSESVDVSVMGEDSGVRD